MTDDISNLLKNYEPSTSTKELIRQTKTVFLVGVSGAGKNTITHHLLSSGDYYHIISHTTRSPRSNNGLLEKEGKDYHFISFSQAKDMLVSKEFVEAKCYGGNIYGTSAHEFELASKAHKVALTDVDVQGVAEYMSFASENTYPIFSLPPSYEAWFERWQKRYGAERNDTEFKNRLQTAVKEIEHALQTDYFYIVVNDDLDKAIRKVSLIVKTGKQSLAEREAGLVTARQVLAGMKQQISTR